MCTYFMRDFIFNDNLSMRTRKGGSGHSSNWFKVTFVREQQRWVGGREGKVLV